jgi:hypothetical protein
VRWQTGPGYNTEGFLIFFFCIGSKHGVHIQNQAALYLQLAKIGTRQILNA